MKIDDWGLDKEILIVAEIGNNHEGSYALAEEMIGLAAQSGAGAVKFQTIIPNKLVSPGQEIGFGSLSDSDCVTTSSRNCAR